MDFEKDPCSFPVKCKWCAANLLFGGLSARALMHMERPPSPRQASGSSRELAGHPQHATSSSDPPPDRRDLLRAGSPCLWWGEVLLPPLVSE